MTMGLHNDDVVFFLAADTRGLYQEVDAMECLSHYSEVIVSPEEDQRTSHACMLSIMRAVHMHRPLNVALQHAGGQ